MFCLYPRLLLTTPGSPDIMAAIAGTQLGQKYFTSRYARRYPFPSNLSKGFAGFMVVVVEVDVVVGVVVVEWGVSASVDVVVAVDVVVVEDVVVYVVVASGADSVSFCVADSKV